uniref:Uncharacterized protein LOC105036106 n=1 Tax=Elaeis guineensis var. tenera TaxID=51953 RepID=A0A8N4F0D9_ELAGV|nr:uncharacterized protein LOC105036106 [Elaeis guineensis]
MTQLCNSDIHLLLGLLLDDLLSFCSFLASHPLPLAYFLYFFPYFFRLLSFLSPLILSTSLLLLVLLTISPHDLNYSPPELFGNACSIVLNTLKAKLEGDSSAELLEQLVSMVLAPLDDARPYFKDPVMPALDGDGLFELEFQTMGEFCNHSSLHCIVEESPIKLALDNSQESNLMVSNHGIGDESFNGELGESPFMDALEDSQESEPLVTPLGVGDQGEADKAQLTNKVAEDLSKAFELNNSSRKPDPAADNVGGELMRSTSRRRKQSTYRDSDCLQRDNSMRKEREWKRTLACKLYEERMTYKLCEERTVVEGGEEMDLLWEAYEVSASKDDKLKNNGKKGKKVELEEEDEEEVGQLCCLQALRLSAGKMNLGVGKPNLMKISKVLKGMAMFQRVGRRSSRKG